jgi:hypothetical protein
VAGDEVSTLVLAYFTALLRRFVKILLKASVSIQAYNFFAGADMVNDKFFCSASGLKLEKNVFGNLVDVHLGKIQAESFNFCLPEIEELVGQVNQPAGIPFHDAKTVFYVG